jgi:hypothetical protein
MRFQDNDDSSVSTSASEEKEEACLYCNDLDFNAHPLGMNQEYSYSEIVYSAEGGCRYCDLIVRAVDALFPGRFTDCEQWDVGFAGCIEDTISVTLEPEGWVHKGHGLLEPAYMYLYSPRGIRYPCAVSRTCDNTEQATMRTLAQNWA